MISLRNTIEEKVYINDRSIFQSSLRACLFRLANGLRLPAADVLIDSYIDLVNLARGGLRQDETT